MYVGFGNQEIFRRLSPRSILLCTSLMPSKRPSGSLLSLGVPRLTKFNGFSPIYGKQLACDCGQSMCHAELYELIRELVICGAMAVWTMHYLSTDSDFNVDPTTDFIPTKEWLHYYDIFARNCFKSYLRVIRQFIFNSAMGDLLIHKDSSSVEYYTASPTKTSPVKSCSLLF